MSNKLVRNYSVQHRALKLRIYPTNEQIVLINKTFGCCRQIYNTRLAEHNEFYNNIIKPEIDKEKQKKLWKTAHFSTEAELKQTYSYLTEVSAVALQQARIDCEKAFSNFFKSLSGKARNKQKAPRFKSKKTNNFSYREARVSTDCLNRKNNTIKIPKLGLVKYRHNHISSWFNPEGLSYKNITVRKNPAGEYYAILLCERKYNFKQKKFDDENKAIGLDFSPNELYINSNGLSGKDYGYIPQKQANKKKLKKLQRKFAKTQSDSKNHNKARVKLARFEEKIANKRADFIEKETLRLVQNYQVIGIEDLNLRGMMRFSKNAKNYVDSSWGNFVQKLIWKASKNENNCQIVKADRLYASSQICHCCGFKNPITKNLNIRSWVCPECGANHIRDVNAAINLKMNAIKKIGQGVSELRSVEGVEDLAILALQIGASNEAEDLTSNGQNLITFY